MKEVRNLHTQPLDLEDGTILAAAGTEGSTKTVDSLSERDERLVRLNLISVRNQVLKAVPPQTPQKPAEEADALSAAAGKGEKIK
jgi:hypothetical protein